MVVRLSHRVIRIPLRSLRCDAVVTYLDIWPGKGSSHAMADVAGLLAGSLLFVVQYASFRDVIVAIGDSGKLTVADVFGVSHWLVIGGRGSALPHCSHGIERYESRLRMRSRVKRSMARV